LKLKHRCEPSANERIVGFYSTGPKLKDCDIQIDHMFRKYSPDPVLVIIDVRPDQDSIPTKAYGSIEVQVYSCVPANLKEIARFIRTPQLGQ
jgi:26S proteasome regulatory subunit N8